MSGARRRVPHLRARRISVGSATARVRRSGHRLRSMQCYCCGEERDADTVASLACHDEIKVCRVCIGWLMQQAGGVDVTPTLPVADMDEATDFYERAGFHVEHYSDEFAFVTVDDQSVFDLDLAAGMEPATNHAGCYVITEGHRCVARPTERRRAPGHRGAGHAMGHARVHADRPEWQPRPDRAKHLRRLSDHAATPNRACRTGRASSGARTSSARPASVDREGEGEEPAAVLFGCGEPCDLRQRCARVELQPQAALDRRASPHEAQDTPPAPPAGPACAGVSVQAIGTAPSSSGLATLARSSRRGGGTSARRGAPSHRAPGGSPR